MLTHSFHAPGCPETKEKSVGPMLGGLATLVGIVAPFNIVPQIIAIFHAKSVANISLLTYLIVIATQFVWLVYGIKLSLKPLILSSIVVIFLSGIIAFQFFLYKGLY